MRIEGKGRVGSAIAAEERSIEQNQEVSGQKAEERNALAKNSCHVWENKGYIFYNTRFKLESLFIDLELSGFLKND